MLKDQSRDGPFAEYSVKLLPYVVASIIQVQNHYLHTPVQSVTHSFGLVDQTGSVVGVLMFGPPSGANVAGSFFGDVPVKVADLKRMWVHDAVPGNAESFFMAGAMSQLKKDYEAVVAYADPEYHTGRVYLAANFTYCGQGSTQTAYRIHGKSYNARSVLNGVSTHELRQYFGDDMQLIVTPGKLRYARVIVDAPRKRRAQLESLLSVFAGYFAGQPIREQVVKRERKVRQPKTEPMVCLRDMNPEQAAAFYLKHKNQPALEA